MADIRSWTFHPVSIKLKVLDVCHIQSFTLCIFQGLAKIFWCNTQHGKQTFLQSTLWDEFQLFVVFFFYLYIRVCEATNSWFTQHICVTAVWPVCRNVLPPACFCAGDPVTTPGHRATSALNSHKVVRDDMQDIESFVSFQFPLWSSNSCIYKRWENRWGMYLRGKIKKINKNNFSHLFPIWRLWICVFLCRWVSTWLRVHVFSYIPQVKTLLLFMGAARSLTPVSHDDDSSLAWCSYVSSGSVLTKPGTGAHTPARQIFFRFTKGEPPALARGQHDNINGDY